MESKRCDLSYLSLCALRIRIEMKPRLPFKLHRINRKPRYLSASAISAFYFFSISLDAISIGHFAGEPDRNLYENFGQLVWHEHYAANRRGSLFPPLACTSLAKKQLQPPLVIPLLIPFWLDGETRFQSYCLESVRRVASRRVASPLSNELTFHETFVSGFNFSFRFVSFRDFRRDSEDDWPSAFRICLWRDPIPGNVIVSSTRMLLHKQRVALIMKFS